MPRPTPAQRLPEVARAACRVFIAKGYDRAHIADVARETGLSQGGIYGYVTSKEALFHLAMIAAIGIEPIDRITVPVPTPLPGQTVDLLRHWDPGTSFPALTDALRRDRVTDVRTEFTAVVNELYGLVERNRQLLALIERSAQDLPELSALYHGQLRSGRVSDLQRYLAKRIATGHLRTVPDLATATRFVVEAIAWFAWHRMGDPGASAISDDDARRTVGVLVVEAFVADPPGETSVP